MKSSKMLAIQHLEDALQPYRGALSKPRPAGGWIRALREALGMTNAQLARRLGRAAQTVFDLQEREAKESIQLNSLREVAKAMDCELVYAIVPMKPLQQLLRNRAETIARQTLRRTGYSMGLEGQSLGKREVQRALEREIENVLASGWKRFWE